MFLSLEADSQVSGRSCLQIRGAPDDRVIEACGAVQRERHEGDCDSPGPYGGHTGRGTVSHSGPEAWNSWGPWTRRPQVDLGAQWKITASLGNTTYSSTLRNCMGLPWRDFLTLLRPSRRLMGIRDEPGILNSLLTGSQRRWMLICGLVAGLVLITKLEFTCNGRQRQERAAPGKNCRRPAASFMR